VFPLRLWRRLVRAWSVLQQELQQNAFYSAPSSVKTQICHSTILAPQPEFKCTKGGSKWPPKSMPPRSNSKSDTSRLRNGRPPARSLVARSASLPTLLATTLIVPALGLVQCHAKTRTLVLLWHFCISAVTFVAYAYDKQQATRSRRRIREQTLHLLEMLGGWPGAMVAQRAFRHKVVWAKSMWWGGYQGVFWGIVMVHQAAWTLLLWSRMGVRIGT
jgi:uncharacterized membrane protein YsdA (DUF1294 family)